MELKQSKGMKKPEEQQLLIVPYGIETEAHNDKEVAMRSFNRTLWN